MPRIILLLLSVFLFVTGCGSSSDTNSYIFELIIRNVANPPTIQTGAGQPAVIAFAPAVGAVHSSANPIYSVGAPAGSELETYAEDGDSSALTEKLTNDPGVIISLLGITPIEEGAQSSLLLPNNSYRIVFNVENTSASLSFVLQFLQSNDIFVGGSEIPLFDASGNPMTQDITALLELLDAGTEANQPPGEGADQALSQTQINQGTAESGVVRPVDDGFGYPSVPSMLQVSINSVDVLN